jgi:hypothetical protein
MTAISLARRRWFALTAEASRLVQYFIGGFVIELWSGDLVVTRLEAKTN